MKYNVTSLVQYRAHKDVGLWPDINIKTDLQSCMYVILQEGICEMCLSFTKLSAL